MMIKRTLQIVLLLFVAASVSFLIAKEYAGPNAFRSDQPAALESAAAEGPDRIVLYYFHGSRRCHTCKTIEAYLGETLTTDFSRELEDGTIAWLPVNIEEPQNQHFIALFNLTSSSAIIAEIKKGKIERSKNLDLVWELVRNKPVFMEYVRNAMKEFLKKEDGDG